jgi:hypothetical protein
VQLLHPTPAARAGEVVPRHWQEVVVVVVVVVVAV